VHQTTTTVLLLPFMSHQQSIYHCDTNGALLQAH